MSNFDIYAYRRPNISNAALKSPTPYQLRSLVLDYLNHHCYSETAKAFIEDSTVKELDADGDEVASGSSPCGTQATRIEQLEQRREIRELILAGKVEEAIDTLNRYFPSVLAKPPAPSLSTPLRSVYEGYVYASPTSVESSHLLLNLRLLAFIEASRTQPPVPMTATGKESSSDSQKEQEPTWVGDPNEGADISMEKQILLINKAQKLWALVDALDNPRDRDVYERELKNVVGLLGYKIPERSNIRKYLSIERRQAVAEQVNRAILHTCGLPPISDIELVVRYTSATWLAAKHHGVKRRAGILLPPHQPVKNEKGEVDEKDLPPFDLKEYLDFKKTEK